MQIDAIGSSLTVASGVDLTNTALDQEDFLRLFLTELNFQDPLEPVDNQDFLAQIAEFASIEQNRQSAENIENLVFMNSLEQSTSLLGRQVEIASATSVNNIGTVNAIRYSADGALLTIELPNGAFVTDVRLSQITLVRP